MRKGISAQRFFFLYAVLFLILNSCNIKSAKKNDYNEGKYLFIWDDFIDHWNNRDTNYIKKCIDVLDTTTNRSDFYSELSTFYNKSGRVIGGSDSCQGGVNSSKEAANRINIVRGLRAYSRSRLFLRCQTDDNSIEKIIQDNWKYCEYMTDSDFIKLTVEFDRYASSLPVCDTCDINYDRSRRVIINCPGKKFVPK
jgi:hypothetical protein